jgi:hypothetical protein
MAPFDREGVLKRAEKAEVATRSPRHRFDAATLLGHTKG